MPAVTTIDRRVLQKRQNKMQWEKSDAFEPGDHGNKPFAIRIPSLLVSRGSSGPPNFLTAMWFTAAGAVAMISTPEEFAQRLVQLRDQYAEFKQRTGFKLD